MSNLLIHVLGVLNKALYIEHVAPAMDPFSGPCYRSLLGVVCDVISDVAAEGEGAIGWMFPSNGFILLGSSIADDVAHDTKEGSIARAQEGINSKGNIMSYIGP